MILMMVAIHATVIGYVRSRVSRLSSMQSTAVEIGNFRFQPVANPSKVYHFQLHAVMDPAKPQRGRDRIMQKRMEILEASEQMLRQVDLKWLDDPTQSQIRDQLMAVVQRHLDEPLVQRVLITDWLELPIQAINVSQAVGLSQDRQRGSNADDSSLASR
jgi:hypothetical protein